MHGFQGGVTRPARCLGKGGDGHRVEVDERVGTGVGSGERPGEGKEMQAQGMKGVGRCKN